METETSAVGCFIGYAPVERRGPPALAWTGSEPGSGKPAVGAPGPAGPGRAKMKHGNMETREIM